MLLFPVPLMFIQQLFPPSLSVSVKRICPDPDERCLPARPDLHFIGILRMTASFPQRDPVIPDRDVPVVLAALNTVYVKSFNTDRVRSERNDAEQPDSQSCSG